MPDPYEIAAWRFEQIAPLIDPSLDETRRRALLRERTGKPVQWPGAEERKLSCAAVFGTRVPVRLGLASCGELWGFEDSTQASFSCVVSTAAVPSPRLATAMR